MDDLAERIIQSMDDNTVLFIMGDHGMSDEGDHGGGSKGETETVISAYYKKGFIKYKEPGYETIMKSFKENSSPMLRQMDLAPTLAMLLGLPIPYSNTGQMINDFYINENENNGFSKEFIEILVRDNYMNMLQTEEYMNSIQEKYKKFPNEAFYSISQKYQDIKKEAEKFLNQTEKDLSKEETRDIGIRIIKEMQVVSSDVYELIKRSNSYDFFLMTLGITLSICCFFLFLFSLQYLHVLIKSEKLSQNWKEDISLSEILAIINKEISSNRLLQFLGLCIFICTIIMKLGTLKGFSLFVVLVVLRMLLLLGKLSVNQTKLFLQESKEKESSLKNNLSKLRTAIFLFESPLDTILSIFVIAFQLVVRLSVAVTRLESTLSLLLVSNRFKKIIWNQY